MVSGACLPAGRRHKFQGSKLLSNAPVSSSCLLRCANTIQLTVDIISFLCFSIFKLLSNTNAFNSSFPMLDVLHSFWRDFLIIQAYLNHLLLVLLTRRSEAIDWRGNNRLVSDMKRPSKSWSTERVPVRIRKGEAGFAWSQIRFLFDVTPWLVSGVQRNLRPWKTPTPGSLVARCGL